MTSVDRSNRLALAVVGVVAAGTGIYGLARGFGASGSRATDEPILTREARDLVARNEQWLWPVAVVVCLALALIGARWLLAQVRAPGVGDLALAEDDEGPGRTRVRASGAAAALASDIGSYPGVRSAAARVVGDGPRPSLDVHASLEHDADPVDVRRRIEEHGLPRLAQALGRDVAARCIRLRLAPATTRSAA